MASGLANTPGVGWHWFNYMDNDPSDLTTDPANRDSKKDIVTFRFEPCPTLIGTMRQPNEPVHRLADYFDRRKPWRPSPRRTTSLPFIPRRGDR